MASRSKHSPLSVRDARGKSDVSPGGETTRRDGDDEPFERNIHAYVAGALGREIVGGIFPPGSLLPSAEEMRARFSVSRTSLREAYSQLTAKALIVARPKVGTRVRPRADWNLFDPDVLAWHLQSAPTEGFVCDLFVLRQMVEPAAAALAATARSRATIDRIADAYALMERYQHGAGDLIDADLQFHMAILEATGNHFLTALGGLMHAALQSAFRYSWEGAARIQSDRLRQHGAVLRAIRDGAPTVANERMSELLRDSENDVRVFFRARRTGKESNSETRSTGKSRIRAPS
jgi:GntR family galactonate operon transcriptional repressor